MAKLEVSVAVSKVMGAFVTDLKGRNEVKKCVCIPVEKLSVDKNGTVWLNLSATDDTKYEGMTHSLKQKLSRTEYQALPEDENGRKVLTPFVGNIKKAKENNSRSIAPSVGASDNPDDDLPF